MIANCVSLTNKPKLFAELNHHILGCHPSLPSKESKNLTFFVNWALVALHSKAIWRAKTEIYGLIRILTQITRMDSTIKRILRAMKINP